MSFPSYLRQQSIYGNPFGNGMIPPLAPPEGDVDISNLRMESMFNPSPVNPQQNSGEDPMQEFVPEHSAQDRYNQLANSYPQEGHIGILRKIAAVAAGLGGPTAAQETILHGPHNSAIADWERQIKPAGEAANMERYANSLDASTAYRGGQLSNTAARNKTYAEDVASKDAARQERAKLDNWKMSHPKHQFTINKLTGHLEARDPSDPNDLPTDLGPTQLSEREVMDTNFEHAKQIAAIKGDQAKELKATPSADADKPLLPSQDQILTNQAYENYYNTKQPGYELMKRDPDTKRWDVTGLNTPELTQGIADYVKNFRASRVKKNPSQSKSTERIKALDENGRPVTVASGDIAGWLAENPKRRKR